jgi:hypothetical protein
MHIKWFTTRFVVVSLLSILTTGFFIFFYVQKPWLKSQTFASTKEPLHPSHFDDVSWILLLNSKADEQTDLFSNLDASEKTLLYLYKKYETSHKAHESQTIKNILSNYPEIQALCGDEEKQAEVCQSGRIMAELLSGKEQYADTGQAFSFFKFFKTYAKLESPEQQVEYLKNEMGNKRYSFAATKVLKIAHVRILIRMGEFESAEDFIKDTSSRELEKSPLLVYLEKEQTRTECQTEALNNCDTQKISACKNDQFWSEWNLGCSSAEIGSGQPKLQSRQRATALAQWWQKIRQNKNADLGKWDEQLSAKGYDASDLKNDPYQEKFLDAVEEALNLVIAAKSDEPTGLLERSKLLKTSNPLWAWSQKLALKELGSQWLALMKPTEKDLVSRYALLATESDRNIASSEKNK